MDYVFWIEIAILCGLLALSAFFSSSETSLFSLNERILAQMKRNGNPRSTLIEKMLSKPRRLIITILIGNELVNVSASVISAAIIIDIFGADKKWLNMLVMVPVLLLFGEITPKTLAMRHSVAFASFQSRPIEFFAWLITPIRMMVRNVADLFITLMVGKERSQGNIITQDMVRVLAVEAVGEGALDPFEAQYINHIFDFGNQTIEEVMTPRSSIFYLPVSMPIMQIIEELRRTRFTKVPIYHETRDRIIGVLFARDLQKEDLQALHQNPVKLKKILRKPYFVPENKPVAELFHTLRKDKRSLAIAVDEYGGVTGLVTMEDLLESIFGEIRSASDRQPDLKIEKLDSGKFKVSGAMTIEQFNAESGRKLDDDSVDTLAGLLLNRYGELPLEGATIKIDDLAFTITNVSDNRIMEIMIEKIGQVDEELKTSPTTVTEGTKTEGAVTEGDDQ